DLLINAAPTGARHFAEQGAASAVRHVLQGETTMGTMDAIGLALRAVVGVTMIAHGYNHWRGPGGLAGTAKWFGGIGLRPPRFHASASVLVELGAGTALMAGLLTPLAAAGVVGTMVVAGVAAHRSNGFFVFKDGYEYVLLLAVVCLCLSALGPGRISLDHALGIVVDGAAGAAIAGMAGIGGALVLLAACWRPRREPEPEKANGCDRPKTSRPERRTQQLPRTTRQT